MQPPTLVIAAVALSLLVVLVSQAYDETYYVATNGIDSASGEN